MLLSGQAAFHSTTDEFGVRFGLHRRLRQRRGRFEGNRHHAFNASCARCSMNGCARDFDVAELIAQSCRPALWEFSCLKWRGLLADRHVQGGQDKSDVLRSIPDATATAGRTHSTAWIPRSRYDVDVVESRNT